MLLKIPFPPWQCCNTLVMSDRPSASNIAIGSSGAHARAYDRRQASFALQAPSPCNFKVALKLGLRCLLRSADPACNTAATCRPCRPAASMRTLQQACRPCSSLQQACRPLQQAYSCRVCRPLGKPADPAAACRPAGLRALQQACRPLQQACRPYRPRSCSQTADPAARRPYRPYSKPAKPAGCLSPQPGWLPVLNYLDIFLLSHGVHFPF